MILFNFGEFVCKFKCDILLCALGEDSLVKKEKNRAAIWKAIAYLQKKEQNITAVAVAQRTKLNERTVRNHFKEMFPK